MPQTRCRNLLAKNFVVSTNVHTSMIPSSCVFVLHHGASGVPPFIHLFFWLVARHFWLTYAFCCCCYFFALHARGESDEATRGVGWPERYVRKACEVRHAQRANSGRDADRHAGHGRGRSLCVGSRFLFSICCTFFFISVFDLLGAFFFRAISSLTPLKTPQSTREPSS